jgi:hypothetical protein
MELIDQLPAAIARAMLVRLLNLALKARNGSAIVGLSWRHMFTLPVGLGVLTCSIADAWCIERPSGGRVGKYPDPLSAFAAAWRMKRRPS